MTMSNYFYHSQDPTPEKWVHTDEPCQHLYPNNKSLSSNVIPALTSWARNRTDIPKVTQTDLDNIVDVCLSLWRKRDDLRNATFYEHLLKLDKTHALRLATAQMTIASSAANKYLAGGDLLRMANNIIKFENMQTSSSNIQVLSMPMGDFITDTKNATMKFIDFVFGDDKKITHEMRLNLAEQRAEKYKNKKASNSHVMSNNASLTESKEGLRQMLQNDKHLGPTTNRYASYHLPFIISGAQLDPGGNATVECKEVGVLALDEDEELLFQTHLASQ